MGNQDIAVETAT